MLISYLTWLTFLHYLINFHVVVNVVPNLLKNKSIFDVAIYHSLLFQNTPYWICIVSHGYYYSKFFFKGLAESLLLANFQR